jgi:hypothetical protein
LSAVHTIRIGPGGIEGPSGQLRDLLGAKDGWILVRPDLHIAWARHSPEGVEEAVAHSLGGGGP